jgi:hypothetical protein
MGGEDYFAYQGRKTAAQPRAAPPVVYAPPLPRSADDRIDVEEHAASTTIIEQIRDALLRRFRGE